MYCLVVSGQELYLTELEGVRVASLKPQNLALSCLICCSGGGKAAKMIFLRIFDREKK